MFPQLGFVDTLLKDPTFWSFNSGGAAKVSNQFAAMPSVHIAWATWCALALGPAAQDAAPRERSRGLPGDHVRRDRDHREPLLPRRGRRPRDLRDRLGRRRTRSHGRAGSTSGGSGPVPDGRSRHLVSPARDRPLRPRPRRARRARHLATRCASSPASSAARSCSAARRSASARCRCGSAPHDGDGMPVELLEPWDVEQERLPRPVRRPPRQRPAPPHVQGPRPRRRARTRARRGLPPGERRRLRPGVERSVPHAARGARHGGAARGVARPSGDAHGTARPRRASTARTRTRAGGSTRARRPATARCAASCCAPRRSRPRSGFFAGVLQGDVEHETGDDRRSRLAAAARASGSRRTPTRTPGVDRLEVDRARRRAHRHRHALRARRD